METSPPLGKQRYVFIDVYRTAIILLMLEGHVLRALLTPDIQAMDWFRIHEILHGLTAPAFLFGAGLTFVISTRKRWTEYHHWGSPLARRIGRFLIIIGLGLAIHLPFYSFRKIALEGVTRHFLQLFQCDVLACIGIGLLSLHAVLFFFRNESWFYRFVIGISLGLGLLTPFIWSKNWLDLLPLPVAQLLNMNNGSQFPIFPYVGFLFAGVITSWEFLVAVEKGKSGQFFKKMTYIGIAMIAGSLLIEEIPGHEYGTHDFWYTCPSYFFIRIGSLLLITSLVWYYTRRISSPTPLGTVVGRESLFVYVLHLPLLYGSVLNVKFNISEWIGMSMTVIESLGVFALLVIFFYGLAYWWNFLKKRHTQIYRLIQVATALTFIIFFFTRDY